MRKPIIKKKNCREYNYIMLPLVFLSKITKIKQNNHLRKEFTKKENICSNTTHLYQPNPIPATISTAAALQPATIANNKENQLL